MEETTLEAMANHVEAETEVILDNLRSPLQKHIALSHANRLLTKLLSKLRPIRDRTPEGGVVTRYLANEEGLGVLRVKKLTRMIEDGIAQIEGQQLNEASLTFGGLTKALEAPPELDCPIPSVEVRTSKEVRPLRSHSADRRSNRRTSINARAGLWYGEHCERFAIVNLRNISSSGLRIRTDFALDSDMRFKIRYAGLLLYGKVIRCESTGEKYDVGAELEGIFLFPSQQTREKAVGVGK